MSAPTRQQILSHESRTGIKNIAMRRSYNDARTTNSSNSKVLTGGTGKKKKKTPLKKNGGKKSKRKKKRSTGKKKKKTPMKKNEFYNVHTRERETVDVHLIRVVETKNGRFQAVANDSKGRKMCKFVSNDFNNLVRHSLISNTFDDIITSFESKF